MGNVILAWDLKTGKAQQERHKPLDIPLASILDPATVDLEGPTLQVSGSVDVDIWGLDRRMVIVADHFYKRAAWWTPFAGFGIGIAGYDTKGYGYTVTVKAQVLVRQAGGEVHVIGDMPAALWLNGGAAPDGCELISGTEGIRLHYEIAVATGLPGGFSGVPSWNLVLHLSAVPNERIGCGEIVAAIGDALSMEMTPALVLFPGFAG